MVSTRQMSITTIGPEIGVANVVSNTASRISVSNHVTHHQGTMGSHTRQNATTSNSATSDGTAKTYRQLAMLDNSMMNDDLTKSYRQLTLLDMPLEIIDKIFFYAGYKEVSNMRLVSRQMNQTCVTLLNSTFSKLQTQLMRRFQNIKKVMPRRESARRSHPLSYECDIVETCCMRLSLLQMTFGRYIEHKHCCFFPGAILDEVYNVMNYIRTTPKIGRPYKITEELIDLSTMAMEYFKDHLEPSLPQFGLFSKDFLEGSSSASTKNCYLFESSSSSSNKSGQSNSMPSPPQSNMVLRKGIRKIKQGMKKYNNQLTVLRTDLRFCKRKSTDQTKQITELQNMLAEQQKQTLEYANRLDENDKKSEEMSRKISTLLQELNKCKIELHYWRSKSPATPICNNCGQTTLAVPPTEDILALLNQSINPDDLINMTSNSDLDADSEVQSHESSIADLTLTATQLIQKLATVKTSPSLPSIAAIINKSTMGAVNGTRDLTNDECNTINNTSNEHGKTDNELIMPEQQQQSINNSVILATGLPKLNGKRKLDAGQTIADNVTSNSNYSEGIGGNASSIAMKATNIANSSINSNISDNCNKKARRVQNKIKCQINNVNIKTRNK